MKRSRALPWLAYILLVLLCAALLPAVLHMPPDSETPAPGEMHFVIIAPTQKTVEALMSLELPAGVEIEIKL